jgi:hypothetical protein
MKKLAALFVSCVIMVSFAAPDQPKEADQKWLSAVEKMVANGEKKVSTPNADRVQLLKDWGTKNGYSINVTKTPTGYTVEVSKHVAQR